MICLTHSVNTTVFNYNIYDSEIECCLIDVKILLGFFRKNNGSKLQATSSLFTSLPLQETSDITLNFTNKDLWDNHIIITIIIIKYIIMHLLYSRSAINWMKRFKKQIFVISAIFTSVNAFKRLHFCDILSTSWAK